MGLVHTQKVRNQSEKPTYVSCVTSTCVHSPFWLSPDARFKCPLLGRKQTFPRFTHRSALDPNSDLIGISCEPLAATPRPTHGA